ncbi:MAG: TolC family protein, partial [Proteobacteria bacterium]|nr:TolC family protein [Pseudomonadota bacterium]
MDPLQIVARCRRCASTLLLAQATLCLAPAALAPAAEANEPVAAVQETFAPLLTGLRPAHETPLALARAVALGLRNNLDVEIARYVPLLAGLSAEQAWGAYDPRIASEVGWFSGRQPNANAVLGVDRLTRTELDERLSISGMVPYLGAGLGVDVAGSKRRSNAAIATLSPEWDASVTVSASIPLLRGLIWNEAWTQIKVSHSLSVAAREEFRERLMDFVQSLEVAYWNVVAQRERLRVAEKSLATAETLLDQSRSQLDLGVQSELQVVEAEAGVGAREFALIRAQERHQLAQDRLIDLVLGTDLSGAANLRFVPTDAPDAFEHRAVDVTQAVARAFAQRPELAASQQEIERLEFQLRYAKNSRLPQFDLQASYSATGKSGDNNPDDDLCSSLASPLCEAGESSESGNAGFRKSFSRISGANGGDLYNVRGVLSIPFPNTTARKAVAKAEVELRRATTL